MLTCSELPSLSIRKWYLCCRSCCVSSYAVWIAAPTHQNQTESVSARFLHQLQLLCFHAVHRTNTRQSDQLKICRGVSWALKRAKLFEIFLIKFLFKWTQTMYRYRWRHWGWNRGILNWKRHRLLGVWSTSKEI